MSWIGDRLFAIFDQLTGQVVSNTIDSVKLEIIKGTFANKLKEHFLIKYENELYFNSLDAFLRNNNVFENFISDCYNLDRNSFVSETEHIGQLCNRFVESRPENFIPKKQVEDCLKELFDMIFDTLNNPCFSEVTRIISNQLKVGLGEVKEEIKSGFVNTDNQFAQIKTMLEKLDKNSKVSTKVAVLVYEFLNNLEVDLDKEDGDFVLRALNRYESSLNEFNEESITYRIELLRAKALLKTEKVDESNGILKSLCLIYPKKPEAFLYLADNYLRVNEIEKNEEYLKKAEDLDKTHWLLLFEKLLRKHFFEERIDITEINERVLPNDNIIKSNLYRIYSLLLNDITYNDNIKFIEQAISFNPNCIKNYIVKLSIYEKRLINLDFNDSDFKEKIKEFSLLIDETQKKVYELGCKSPRIIAGILTRKLEVYLLLNNGQGFNSLSEQVLDIALGCFFDNSIDGIISYILRWNELPQENFDELLNYLKKSDKQISESLGKYLFLQFISRSSIFPNGKNFFGLIKMENFIELISYIEIANFNNSLPMILNDVNFAISVANTVIDYSELRIKIIESLPNNVGIEKDKLYLLLHYHEKNYDEAFKILRNLDLSNLTYFECKTFLEIANKKKAWEIIIPVLEKLLQLEENTQNIVKIKIDLFNAYFEIGNYPNVIKYGNNILSNNEYMKPLDDENKERLLTIIITSHDKRGEFPEAAKMIENYNNLIISFDIKIGVEADVYIKNLEAEKAIKAIVDGMKIIKYPTPEYYSRVFFLFVQIGNIIEFNANSLGKVTNDKFVKLKHQEQWYFIGEKHQLDATKINSSDPKYPLFIDKCIGEKICFDNKYGVDKSELEIESILPIDKYILSQSIYYFNKLSEEHRLNGVNIVSVVAEDGKTDLSNLINYMRDNSGNQTDFLKMYSEQLMPFVFLCINCGGISNALGSINNSGKGYVNFSSGDNSELEQQKEVAKKIIEGGVYAFDVTSALFLSEIGLLEKIYNLIPNFRVPQSVINSLLEIKNKFYSMPGHKGYMGYLNDNVTFSSIEHEKKNIISNNFLKIINILESEPNKIIYFSDAIREGFFSDLNVPNELRDACIFSQKNNIPILTEDYSFLLANEAVSQVKAADYCSSFVLVRELTDQGKLDFESYLKYFGYLTSYRFRFLQVRVDDIYKAVFDANENNEFKPENIQYFNFPFTLSADYGISEQNALLILCRFFLKIIINDVITIEHFTIVYKETFNRLPINLEKQYIRKAIFQLIFNVIEKTPGEPLLAEKARQKLDVLNIIIK